MQIDNLIIDTPLIDIISKLHDELELTGKQYFAKYFDSGDDIMVCCPYHKDGQERRPSAGVRKSDGVFHCLACGETHSLPEMVSHCFGEDGKFAKFGYQWLAKNFVSVEVRNRNVELDIRRDRSNYICSADSINFDSGNSRGRISSTTVRANVRFITEEELDKYRYTHPYLYERGLTDDIIELFDIGYATDTNSITFPVKNSEGKCIFIARRNVNSKHFNIPRGIEKPLYGLYECLQVLEQKYGNRSVYPEPIYVCEGPFDCLRFWCNDKLAVAGFGCLFNEYQLSQLRSLPVRKLVDALDNDKPGRDGAERIIDAVKNKLIASIVYPENKKDPGELTDNELQNLKEIF